MTEQRELRVSDDDRQAAAERLRAAHDEGRLGLYEYDDRLVPAYSSVTYADLDRLVADLPVVAATPAATSAVPGGACPPSGRPVQNPPSAGRWPVCRSSCGSWINVAFVVAVNLTV